MATRSNLLSADRGKHQATDTKSILKEAKVLAGLRDKYIVEVFSLGELPDGSLYLVMEYVEGKTLSRSIFELGHLPESRVVDIGFQICQAIRTLHLQKIIHRDLKSANVILSCAANEDIVKVVDFGLSKMVKSENQHKTSTETKTGMLVGTVDYMSPEVCSGQKATEASDIYSLGCILFECLTGRLPFVCDNWVGLIYKHQHEQAPKPSTLQAGISPILDAIVLKCLAKDPSDRFSVSELQEHLHKIQCGITTEVRVSAPKGLGSRIKYVACVVVLGLLFC
ncbi:MAG TPA: serine/threonine-protein kinase, partial [Candidatus Obscuribacter sp.]|nr:serine/threonine-protein kinase [Candidatus Obscuribacter sp.]